MSYTVNTICVKFYETESKPPTEDWKQVETLPPTES